MVQQVTIPLEWANNIPGVSGIDDVEFSVPEVDDIVDPILDAIPSRDDLETAAEEGAIAALEDATPIDEIADAIVDPVVDEIEAATGIDFPDPDELAEDIADALGAVDIGDITVDIEGSLFSLQNDFVDVIAEALEQAALDEITQFPSLGEIETAIEDATPDLEDVDIPDIDDIQDALEDALEDVEPTVDGAGFFTQPVQFVVAVIDEALDLVVDDSTQDDLQEAIQTAQSALPEEGENGLP